MEFLKTVLNLFVSVSLGLALLRSYFMVNKIWKRKHERVVSESISIFAEMIGLLTASTFLLKYVVFEADVLSSINMFMEICISLTFLLIGIGYWVQFKNKPRTFWGLFKKALRLERKEAGDLFSSFLRPVGADKLLTLMHELAMVDQVLDPKEEQFIRRFAEQWNLVYIPKAMGSASNRYESYEKLRKIARDYVALTPPIDQVSQLTDILELLIKADAHVSEDESLIHDEVRGMLEHYVDEDSLGERYKVIIAPQNPVHEQAITSLLPGRQQEPCLGGTGFLVGEYHSRSFARVIAERYRSFQLFTTVEVEKLPPPLPPGMKLAAA